VAEILGLGITHQPPLATEPVKPLSLRLTLQDPGLPEALRTPDGWPENMRREWGTDEGAAHAREHRAAIVAALREARAVLDEFRPDVIVVWGDDQYENFREDVIPAFCILAYDRVVFAPWENGPPANHWDEPKDKSFVVDGHQAAAKYLAGRLLSDGFDVAYAYRPLHVPLGHAFRNSVLYLDWDRTGFPYALIPFSVNCYGRHIIERKGYLANMLSTPSEEELDPPSPTPRRCFDLGAACARAFRDSPWRVALVASSSWSHAFLTQKNHYLYPDHAADQELYRALIAGDFDVWRERTLEEVEASGQQELLNWFCLVGAMAELGRRPEVAAYFESSVMNSNKVIATFWRDA